MSNLEEAFNAIKQNYESVEEALRNEREKLEKIKQEHKSWQDKLVEKQSKHAALVAELEAKQFAAVKAGEEAAARIKVGNDQVAELMRIRKEQADQDKELKVREQAIVAREVKNRSWALEISERESTVKDLEWTLSEKARKLREAIA
jgi:chromosome segregation ATPase